MNSCDQREPGHAISRQFLELLAERMLPIVVPSLVLAEDQSHGGDELGGQFGVRCIVHDGGPPVRDDGAAGWKPGTVLTPPVFVPFGRGRLENACIAPVAADWNGDGVFDIIFGKTNGHIAVAINRGTKEQPKFDQPFEVKGEDVWKQGSMSAPGTWRTVRIPQRT